MKKLIVIDAGNSDIVVALILNFKITKICRCKTKVFKNVKDTKSLKYKLFSFLNKRYLYNPAKNIELGCAYLAKIRYVYFKDIRDDRKAFICSIPAYNTGIGNVSKTLSNSSNLSKASEAANRLDFDKLYNKLKDELKYKEARDYLVRVWERKNKY